MNLPVSVQLYTVRDETNRDFIGTLEKISEMGYDGVEFAGFGGISSSIMKQTLDRLGLVASGSHVSEDLLKNDIDEIIRYHKEIGAEYIICPYSKLETKSDIDEFIKLCNKVGLKCKENGITFCYHNHAHEFECIDGIPKLDILYNRTNKEFLEAEMDTFWIQYADASPLDYISKYSGRVPLVHIKDMDNMQTKVNTEAGTGIMDIKAIVEAAKNAGAKWIVVEQDVCILPSLESIKISIDNIRKIRFS